MFGRLLIKNRHGCQPRNVRMITSQDSRIGPQSLVEYGASNMDPSAAYQQTAVTTQSKGRIIVMLYEGAIKFMKLAIKEIQAGNLEAKGKYISKARDIISELNNVLDVDAGGEIAFNLRRLYTFMDTRLSQANIKQDTEMIQDVITLMEELNQSWKAITS